MVPIKTTKTEVSSYGPQELLPRKHQLERMQRRRLQFSRRIQGQARPRFKILGPSNTRPSPEPDTTSHTPTGTEYAAHLVTKGQLDGHDATIMIDSGACGNFIAHEFIKKEHISTQVKAEPYTLSAIDGTPFETAEATGHRNVKDEINGQLSINGHLENITLDIIPIESYDIVLGMPWLRKHNPPIN